MSRTPQEKPEDSNYYGILRSIQSTFYLSKSINIIGRSQSCNIIINHPSVSKENTSIEFSSGEVILRDLNSANGLIINDRKIKDGMTIKMKSGDRIKFGKDQTTFVFEINLQNSNILTEADNTMVCQSIIRDDRISLVNEEFYSKATRNHFDKSNIKKSNTYENPVSGKQLPPILKLPTIANLEIESPKFNQSFKEENTQENQLDVTFKNSKRDKEDLIKSKKYDELNSLAERLKKEKDNVEAKTLELESKLIEKSNDNKKVQNNYDQLSDEYGKLKAKHNALLIYASDIQKKLDLIEVELSEKKTEINKYQSLDWGKLLIEKESLIKIQQSELSYFKQEFNKLKRDWLNIEQKNTTIENSKRTESLLDNYLQENKKLKKTIEEFKQRENECTKKWNELLKENSSNMEKLNIYQQQLNDQSEQFNNIIADYDKRVVETLSRIPKFLENFDLKKSEAAQYLVDQMGVIMEEKRRLIDVNSLIENRVGILNFENEKLKQESVNFREGQTYGNNDVKKLKIKIDELKDLLLQHKIVNPPNKIVEFEETILALNAKTLEKESIIEQLNVKLRDYVKKSNLLFDERQAISSISNAMREKDVVIINLKNQLREAKEINNKNSFESEGTRRKYEDKYEIDHYVDILGSNNDKNFNSNHYIEKVEFLVN